jgi:hypothetical protein
MWGAVRVQDYDFARISWSTIKRNFRIGWEWDVDQFNTNQFAHPYQGAVYFSSARLFGLSFWESVPYAVLGSWQWEMFMENELPSFNDVITTSFGGIFVGEALWRLSNSVLDDTTRGIERVLREIAGLAINPMNGLGRLATGKSWRIGEAPERTPIDGLIRVGVISARTDNEDDFVRLFHFRIDLDYGDVQERADLTTPFEHFDFSLALNFDTEGIQGKSFEGTGLLYGWRLPLAANVPSVLGIYQHFDYWEQPILASGYSSIGAGWDGTWRFAPNWFFAWRLRMFGAFLGGVSSAYAELETDRDYNLGPGAQTAIRFRVGHQRWGFFELEDRRNVMGVASGASGWEHTGLISPRLVVHILGGVGASAEYTLMNRDSWYSNYLNVHDMYHLLSLNIVSFF